MKRKYRVTDIEWGYEPPCSNTYEVIIETEGLDQEAIEEKVRESITERTGWTIDGCEINYLQGTLDPESCEPS